MRIMFCFDMKKKQEEERPKGNLEQFFGTVHFEEDGLEIQRRMRRETQI